jgi:DNA (cytosine-5)-methyltransferase 1
LGEVRVEVGCRLGGSVDWESEMTSKQSSERGLVVDLFAGGGGASTGLEAALKRPVDIAINHDAVALAAHKANHPRTLHLKENLRKVRPVDATGGRPVDVLWSSPDCRHFSKAKGSKPVNRKVRGLAGVVIRWAREVRPRIIFLENVEEFRTWGPLDADERPVKARAGEYFRRWVRRLERLGYQVEHRLLDASHYGAPTRRKRLFVVARRDGVKIRWPSPTHGGLGLKPLRTAAECVDWSIPCPSIFDRKRPLAPKTLHRVALGIRRFVLENPRPFVVSIDQQSTKDTSAPITSPLSAIVTKARHALVAPTLVQTGYGEREGQRPRYLNLHEPLGTLVAQGQKHALVSAFLARHFGGMVGCGVDGPVPTITARDHHSLVSASLAPAPGQPGAPPRSAPSSPRTTAPTRASRSPSRCAPSPPSTGWAW